LTSDAGDWIGGGGTYKYDTTNAAIRVSVLGSRLSVRVDGRESWTGDFQLPGNLAQLQVGNAAGLTRYPFQSGGAGGLDWSGQGRGCNLLTGSVAIRSVTYQSGVLSAIDMSFEQHCEGVGPALRGQITIGASAMAQISVPQNPLPDNPVIALSSDVGDYIGAGGLYAYDSGNSILTITSIGNHLSVYVRGDQQWSADFVIPGAGSALVPGRYTGLSRYPFQGPGAGALSWSGQGRGCNALTGTFVIHAVRYEAGVLAAIDMSFEQHCEGAAAALNGTIRWDAAVALALPGPTNPAPLGLWNSPDGVIPATGNAMYLNSAPGDYIGQGWTWWVGAAVGPGAGTGTTQGSVKVSVSESNGLLKLNLTGDVTWTGEFKAMDSLTHLQTGYYGIVQRFPFHNPARGGMNWSMDGRGCNVLSGWFMVDSISYVGNQLQAVDLRFSQLCDGAIAPLRGRVRWTLTGLAS
jgi:hypothetical protein